MSQKYEIWHETGWDDATQSMRYEKLTTIKNESLAFEFVDDIENIGVYGNMIVKTKMNGKMKTYNDRNKAWE